MAEKNNIFVRIKEYLADVRGEMKKVTWPNKNDLYKTTIAVIVSSVIFGVYLFAIDFIFSRIVKQIINLLK